MLTTVAGRFTTKEQFDAYQTFLESTKTQLGASYDSLNASLTTARANLVWDETVMKKFMEHITNLKGAAPVKAISVLLSVVSIVVLFLFN